MYTGIRVNESITWTDSDFPQRATERRIKPGMGLFADGGKVIYIGVPPTKRGFTTLKKVTPGPSRLIFTHRGEISCQNGANGDGVQELVVRVHGSGSAFSESPQPEAGPNKAVPVLPRPFGNISWLHRERLAQRQIRRPWCGLQLISPRNQCRGSTMSRRCTPLRLYMAPSSYERGR